MIPRKKRIPFIRVFKLMRGKNKNSDWQWNWNFNILPYFSIQLPSLFSLSFSLANNTAKCLLWKKKLLLFAFFQSIFNVFALSSISAVHYYFGEWRWDWISFLSILLIFINFLITFHNVGSIKFYLNILFNKKCIQKSVMRKPE